MDTRQTYLNRCSIVSTERGQRTDLAILDLDETSRANQPPTCERRMLEGPSTLHTDKQIDCGYHSDISEKWRCELFRT